MFESNQTKLDELYNEYDRRQKRDKEDLKRDSAPLHLGVALDTAVQEWQKNNPDSRISSIFWHEGEEGFQVFLKLDS